MIDIGSGTTDVAVIAFEDSIVETKSVCGNTHLGGRDFENRMMASIIKELNREITPAMRKQIILKCEAAKIELSRSQVADIELDFEGIVHKHSMTRSQFESLNEDLFEKIIAIIKQAISDAKIGTFLHF